MALEIIKCTNGVGVWEVIVEDGVFEVFDTLEEAKARANSIYEEESQRYEVIDKKTHVIYKDNMTSMIHSVPKNEETK